MKIQSVHRIKGRGLCVTCKPTERPSPGSVVRCADGRAWLATAVDLRWPWHPGESVGLFLQAKEDGQADPTEGDEAEIIEPLSLLTALSEADHNVRALRAALSKAHRRAQAAEGLIRRTGIADDIDAIDPARLLDVLTNRATERYHDQTRAVRAENERLTALLAAWRTYALATNARRISDGCCDDDEADALAAAEEQAWAAVVAVDPDPWREGRP